MHKNQIFKGVITAIITPQKNGKIDLEAFNFLINRQIEAEIDGIVVAGSTGEGICLSISEVDELLSAACKASELAAVSSGSSSLVLSSNEKKIPIIAGVSTASTAEALERVKAAQKHNIDGLMLTAPYYLKPSQEAIIEHYKVLHDNSRVPIIIYDNPGRTAVSINDNTIIQLSHMKRIIALKDASDNLQRPLMQRYASLNVKYEDDIHYAADVHSIDNINGNHPQKENNFIFLGGNDDDILAYIANGGHGLVSVLSNIVPQTMKKLVNYAINGERERAIKLQGEISNFAESIFAVTNPIGVKCAHAYLGHCTNEMRMPLMPPSSMAINDHIKYTVMEFCKKYK